MTAPAARSPATEELVRPALEQAVAVAKEGERQTPPVPAPRALRPMLGFARLPPAALGKVRKVLEQDADFRARVAESAGEEALGRPSWLFLARPAGWEQELESHAEAVAAAADAAAEDRAERSAIRRLRRAEEAFKRAEAERDSARAEQVRAHDELAVERRGRRAAEEEVTRLAASIAAAQAGRDEALRRAEEASGRLQRSEAEVEVLREQLARTEAETAGLRAGLEAGRRPTRARGGGEHAGGPAGGPGAGPEPVVGRHAAAPAPWQPEEVARAVAQAADAAVRLGGWLAAASEALSAPPSSRPDLEGRQPPAGMPAAEEPPEPPAAPSPARAPTGGDDRRLPVLLPPAIFDDAPEAARFLLRNPGAVLLVDGYNASLAIWPELAIPDQRDRLIGALGELSARSGASVHVVFDGVDVEGGSRPVAGRSAVKVTFSPGGVEADDVILALVDQAPPTRPVVVASNDRRVQREARRRGANVITVTQLQAVLRRER